MEEKQDLLIFKQVQEGNREAFSKVFREYYEPVARFIFRFVKDADTAEEIAQDMFIHFWEHAKRINITTSLKAYLFTSARNFSLNHIKKHKIREKYHEAAKPAQEAEIEESRQENSVFSTLLRKSLETLPVKCREIFELSKYEGLSHEEIATYLDISRKTVENQVGIALRKIREWMEPHLDKIYE